jgi:hypothetical protein
VRHPQGFRFSDFLVRDQEVDGSNPFAPTNSFNAPTYDFWFFVYTAVDDFVDGQTFQFLHVSGSGTLALFGFTALALGTSDFTISNVLLQDSSGAILSSTTTGGSVTVQGTATVAEPSGLTLLGTGLLVLAGSTLKKHPVGHSALSFTVGTIRPGLNMPNSPPKKFPNGDDKISAASSVG